MKQVPKREELITERSQLLEFFQSGIKHENEFKVGVEYEKIGINRHNYTAVEYDKLCQIIKTFKKTGEWEFIHEDHNIMGLQGELGSITLEPGSQTEFSMAPAKTIHDIYNSYSQYSKITAGIGEEIGVSWLGYGIQPLSTYDNIQIIPKKRYKIMTDYLPTKSPEPFIMMRESASIQISYDFSSEEDATKKLRTSLALSPIITAMFSNSPIRGGVDTGYKSYRAYGWLRNDQDRCGLISKKLFCGEEFSFNDYVDVILDLPMFFINKDENWINMNGTPFREYLKNGYKGYKATISDWLLHSTTFFPETRLNNYVEIRNCDCQKLDMALAAPALWKGIMYNHDALDAAWDLVKDFSWDEIQELRYSVPKLALEAKVKNIKVVDLAKELFNISEKALKIQPNMNEKGQNESIYLEKLKELLFNNKTPADIILKNWHNNWNKDLSKLVEHLKIS